jgi:hypothetical protein
MKLRQYFTAGALALGMSFGTMAAPVTAFADTIVAYADDDVYSDAMSTGEATYSSSMYASAANWDTDLKLYDTDGNIVKARDCFVEYSSSGNVKGYIPGNKFESLTTTSQQDLLDRVQAYGVAYAQTTNEKFDTSTAVADWWDRVVSTNGVGANYVSSLTQGLKADLTAGYSVFKPLQSIINTILGAGAIIIIAFLLVSILIDLFYITLPPVRMAMEGSGKNGNGSRGASYSPGHNHGGGGANGGPKYVSAAAREAVNAEESGENGLMLYLKKSIVKIIVLALCLVLLISGQIFTFVGWVLNLVADMFGLSF